MDILRFITCGSVDDGKSTLIGRLLYDSHAVSLDILNAIERQTKNKANGEIDLSLLTDGLRAEREQGITIDVAYKYFTTKRRKFIIADAPGHVQYTRNMVTGASNADLAIVLIDARQGVIEQTRRHSLIVSLLGIPRIVVAINKMDLVSYDPSVYEAIRSDYQVLAKKLGLSDPTYIPISALAGDNIVEKSTKMGAWYTGKTLLEHLETVEVAADINLSDARFQVQYVIRPRDEAYHDYRGYAGRIQSGVYRLGDRVVVLPSGIESVIAKIEVNLKEVEEAFAGQSAVLHLADDVDVSRGDSIVAANSFADSYDGYTATKAVAATTATKVAATVANELEAHICWFDEKQPLTEGSKLLLQNGSNTIKVIVREIEYKYDISTLEKVEAHAQGKLNDILKIGLKTAKPIVFDTYAQNRQTGSFILVNENSCNTVAAGMITGKFQTDDFEI